MELTLMEDIFRLELYMLLDEHPTYENIKEYEQQDKYKELNPMTISGYVIRRSPTDNKLFNVIAVDENQEWLYTASSDVEIEQAIEDCEQLTKDLEYIQQNYLKGKGE